MNRQPPNQPDHFDSYWRVIHAGREDTITRDETEARNRIEFLRLHFPSSMTTLASQQRMPWVEQDADPDWRERSHQATLEPSDVVFGRRGPWEDGAV